MWTVPVKWVQQEITRQYENHYDVKVLAATLNYSSPFLPLPSQHMVLSGCYFYWKLENSTKIQGLLWCFSSFSNIYVNFKKCVGSYFFDLPFVAFVNTVIHKVLALRTLHFCLTVKGLCSAHREIIWPCPPVNSYNKKKRLIHLFQRLAICGDILQDRKHFHFTPLSLSLRSFDFSSSLLLSPWLYERNWYPDPNDIVTVRH